MLTAIVLTATGIVSASIVMLTSATALILKRPIKGDLTVLGLRAALLVICLPAIACLLLSFSIHV